MIHHSDITIAARPDLRQIRKNGSPAAATGNGSAFFAGKAYAQGLAQFMSFALELRSGLGILSGAPGVGKTTLVQSLAGMLPAGYKIVRIPPDISGTAELLQHIYQKLGLGIAPHISKSHFLEIYQYLNEKFRTGKKVLFWIDDAHLLSPVMLENVIRLSNNDIHHHNILQFILSGLPSLDEGISHLRKTGVAVKIGFRFTLAPLDEEDTATYIAHLLQSTGQGRAASLFNKNIVGLIYRYSGGAIGQIESICRTVLRSAPYRAGQAVRPGQIEKAVAGPKRDEPSPFSRVAVAPTPRPSRKAPVPTAPDPVSPPPEWKIPRVKKYRPQILDFHPDSFRDAQQVAANLAVQAGTRELQVIGFTSAAGKEGVSTLTAMLAHLISQNLPAFRSRASRGEPAKPGKQCILLLDAHLKNPAQHQIFRTFLKPGLIDVLNGVCQPCEAIRGFSRVPLHLLTAGEMTDNPGGELIDCERLQALLEQLRPFYDYILIDLPPVLHSPAGQKLSRLCDGVMVVVRAGVTRYPVVQKAAETLRNAGIPLLGGVLNRRKFYIPERLYRKL